MDAVRRAGLLDEPSAARGEVRERTRQEDHGDREVLGRDGPCAEERRLAVEERARHLDKDPGAVAGLGVGVERAPVGQRLQGLQRVAHDPVLGPAVDVGDEAHAAGVVLELGGIQRMRDGRIRVHLVQVAWGQERPRTVNRPQPQGGKRESRGCCRNCFMVWVNDPW